MSDLDNRLRHQPAYPVEGHCQMVVTMLEDRFVVAFPDSTMLGEVNSQLEQALENLNQLALSYEVIAPTKPILEIIHRALKDKDAVVRVNINVYGLKKDANQVGRELSTNKIYLQRPDHIQRGKEYDNPHTLKLPQFSQPSQQTCVVPVGAAKASEVDKAEAFKKTMSQVYSSLTRSRKLVGLEGDDRLKTPLLEHQKQALDFMMQRESGPIPPEYQLWLPEEIEGLPCYRHAVTQAISRVPHIETGGGILADEMGMGKTLSILALILRTLESAHKWASDLDDDVNAFHQAITKTKVNRSRATLIMASSDLMINEWFQEIDRHFHDRVSGWLKTIKYHGQDRETEIDKLRDADLIITTYHTLASDFAGKKNPLSEVDWYRIVLDEAHIIRRQATGLNRTISQIRAKSRWCLTGTPVQNRLEDIGALFAFLRVNPFHSLSMFRKYITIPFDEGGKRRDLAIRRFTRLMDSLCLRRTKDLLHLPDQRDTVRWIQLSSPERLQYEQTKKMMTRAIRNQVGMLEHKGALGMFQMQLQLRIICNHGTFQQPFSWNRRKMHLLDEQEDMESALGSEGEVTCSSCRQTMAAFGSGITFRHYTGVCKHVLCLECIEESMPDNRNEPESQMPANCPLCSSLWSTATQPHPPKSQHAVNADTYFRSEGHSSKMAVLVQDVTEDLWKTKR
jgi:SWI/SNF-related matrix-associated actin-dependent regulator of chromatin subfamily A3